MGITDGLKAKYAVRLDELIASGSAMPMKQHARQTSYNMLSGESRYHHYNLASWPEFVEWRTSCIAVLDQVVPPWSLLRKTVEIIGAATNEPSKVEFIVGFLRSVKKELDAGSLESFARHIEAKVLSDYLQQAVTTLTGSTDEPNHIAAAVIVGASLERTLRSLCASLSPEEPITNDRGANLGMSALIDALKRRHVFNEVQAKQLRAWAAIRNSAAHGDFAAFSRRQVESMVRGIEAFVVEHTK